MNPINFFSSRISDLVGPNVMKPVVQNPFVNPNMRIHIVSVQSD